MVFEVFVGFMQAAIFSFDTLFRKDCDYGGALKAQAFR